MKLCTFTSRELPGATFRGYAALRQFAAERMTYEMACQGFERSRDTDAFRKELVSLGYDGQEIAIHLAAGPAYRLPEMFLAAA
jgi:hypothetical protein